MLGLVKTYQAVRSANGHAQHIVYAIWGVLIAGVLYNVCPDHIPNQIIIAWGIVSAMVLTATIWLPKIVVKYTILLDTLLCAILCALFIMHPEHVQPNVYMVMTLDGMVTANRNTSSGLTISEEFQIAALVWSFIHGAYLANLVQRQILEAKFIKERGM